MKANLDKNLAPAWVSGKSYSTGEFCLYNKRLYICITDNSDAEFDNSKWERRNLVDLVSGLNSDLSNKPDFAYEPIYKGDYNTNVHTVTVTKDKYYMAIFRDAAGSTRCDISKLSITNATIIKSLADSDNRVCIFWFRANDSTVIISGVADAAAVFFVSELSSSHDYVKDFTSITYVARGFDYQKYTVPCNNCAMIISMGYQGTQSISMSITGESYSQDGFKAIKSYANHSGYSNRGYAHLICESDVDFEVVLCQRNNFLVYIS